jgi:hypothetical protein
MSTIKYLALSYAVRLGSEKVFLERLAEKQRRARTARGKYLLGIIGLLMLTHIYVN